MKSKLTKALFRILAFFLEIVVLCYGVSYIFIYAIFERGYLRILMPIGIFLLMNFLLYLLYFFLPVEDIKWTPLRIMSRIFIFYSTEIIGLISVIMLFYSILLEHGYMKALIPIAIVLVDLLLFYLLSLIEPKEKKK